MLVSDHTNSNVSFTELLDLASSVFGGKAVACNDEFFAPMDNLLNPKPAVFIPDKYTEFGKWMDGWETRRRRTPGYDWCIVKLGVPGEISGVNVDTSFFVGNYPEYCSIEGCEADEKASAKALTSSDLKWTEILPKSSLKGGSGNYFPINHKKRVTHIRLNIFPDGGVARLRVYGEVKLDEDKLSKKEIDLAAAANGGKVVTCNDMFFGPKDNLILPGRSETMGGGWETKRKRGPGHDWIIVRLAGAGKISRLEVDTNHFKGNYPDRCSVEACRIGKKSYNAADFRDKTDIEWVEILPESKLRAHEIQVFDKTLNKNALNQAFDHVRLNIFPDGGISRLRVFGKLT